MNTFIVKSGGCLRHRYRCHCCMDKDQRNLFIIKVQPAYYRNQTIGGPSSVPNSISNSPSNSSRSTPAFGQGNQATALSTSSQMNDQPTLSTSWRMTSPHCQSRHGRQQPLRSDPPRTQQVGNNVTGWHTIAAKSRTHHDLPITERLSP